MNKANITYIQNIYYEFNILQSALIKIFIYVLGRWKWKRHSITGLGLNFLNSAILALKALQMMVSGGKQLAKQ